MRKFVFRENDDRRVFGALRFVNSVDDSQISHPLEVTAAPPLPGLPNPAEFIPIRILRNNRGLRVIQSGTALPQNVATQLSDYAGKFDPTPQEPAHDTLTARLRVVDPTGAYLPADFNVSLPRNAAGGRVVDLLRPLDVRMYPSPSAALASGWAALRVLVWREIPAPTPADANAVRIVPLRGALVRALEEVENTPAADLNELGSGLTEWRPRLDGQPANAAEALVALRDVLVTRWSRQLNGAVFTDVQEVRLQVRFDPAFNADLKNAAPQLDALEDGAPGIVSAELPETFPIRAREQIVRRVKIDRNNQLKDFVPA